MRLPFSVRLRRVALALVLTSPVAAMADAVEDFHTWAGVVATGALGAGSWRYWLEGQGRFNDDSSRFGQGIARGALGYALGGRAVLWAGYGYISTDAPGIVDNQVEHRPWQQLTWSAPAPLAGFELVTRSRLEQRVVEHADDTGWRARQLLKLSYPLRADKRVYLALWDEIFFNFNDTDWGPQAGFDQNRVFAGVGLGLAPTVRTEVGYLHQYGHREGQPDVSHHVLSLTLFLDF